ncbi:MAG: protease HtpX [endosymbiont of Galathealinum brachiosum]|uniref:Protease HtpX n=1 Tax=endosymbiont of Galathealinum brachiosum TaxID=2200906 RepID=A0A370DP44_9GAMM|nr:MAG: protease HtpX [endosymbiont of Galathealinum brachiosum]
MLRIGLFLLTNIAIMIIISLVFSLLGLESTLAQNGVDLNLEALLIMSTVIGMSGSFISLAMSKWSAKRMMGAVVITDAKDNTQRWLLQTVERQAQQAGIKMPEVAIFDSADVNAFATGMNKNAALVAVSTGLLANMKQGEIEAVLAHEVSHVANGDMVTLALVQGIVNTFVIFFSRIVGHLVDRVVFKTQRGYGPAYYITSIVAQIVFGILASSIVMYFSRRREFRADAGGAHLAGSGNMVAALQRLQSIHQPAHMPDQLAAFGINASVASGIRKLFMSHPPLEERIAALQAAR